MRTIHAHADAALAFDPVHAGQPTRDPPAAGRLRIPDEDIIAAARLNGPGAIILVAARQAWRELVLHRVRRIRFRRNRNAEACAAYCAMEVDEFADVNARQSWANWRTIPRNLSGRLPDRPVAALDLCCGIGDSTAVLAWWCAHGSRIIGLEYNPAFVARARARVFRQHAGGFADVAFAAQSVLDPFRDADGRRIADGSIDLINASGAIGCHFDAAATAVLARECARVLRADGLALIDCGSDGTARPDLERIFAAHGFRAEHRARNCLLDRFTQVRFARIGDAVAAPPM